MNSLIIITIIMFITTSLFHKTNQASRNTPNKNRPSNSPKSDKSLWNKLEKELAENKNGQDNFWSKLDKELGIVRKKSGGPKKPATKNVAQKPKKEKAYKPLEVRISHRMTDITDGSIAGKSFEGMGSSEGTAGSEGTGANAALSGNDHNYVLEPQRRSLFASISSNDIVRGIIMSEVLNKKY